MKTILYSLLLLVIPTVLFSQTPVPASKIIYLDSLRRETLDDNYKYIRVIKDYYSKKNSYVVNDFYKSGTLQMAGTSANKDYLQKEGQFVYYFENGKKKSTTNYLKTKPTGKEYNWYENGKLKSEIEYLKDDKELSINYKINQFWNQDGEQKIIDGNGDYKNSDKFGFE
jgi:antitoxin component YwqK of YwqJK toxin-antitoxin module